MSCLYIVGTPIGNLGDFSPRGVETLKTVDFIAAEDTRVSIKLLNRFEISKPLVSYYEHNLRERGEQIVARILGGESCALITDAGMPAISDPGEDLVRICVNAGIEVIAVPGPSAAATALAMSGMYTSRFCFEGFLTVNKQGRREHLTSLIDERRTMIFYEAPHKLRSTLKDFKETFGGSRKLALARELTKIHEEVLRFTIDEAIAYYEGLAPRGEYVIVLEGSPVQAAKKTFLADAVALALSLTQSGMAPAPAAKEAARITGCRKSEIYKQLIEDDR